MRKLQDLQLRQLRFTLRRRKASCSMVAAYRIEAGAHKCWRSRTRACKAGLAIIASGNDACQFIPRRLSVLPGGVSSRYLNVGGVAGCTGCELRSASKRFVGIAKIELCLILPSCSQRGRSWIGTGETAQQS